MSILSSLIIALYLPRAGNRIIEEFSRPRSTTTICREREISKEIFFLLREKRKKERKEEKIVIFIILSPPPHEASRKSLSKSRCKFLKKALSPLSRFEGFLSTVFYTCSLEFLFPNNFSVG